MINAKPALIIMNSQNCHEEGIQAAGKTNRFARRALPLLAGLLAAVLAGGCATSKSKPEAEKVHERGWIGGEFKLARRPSFSLFLFGTKDEFISGLPKEVVKTNRAGILITALGTNAPARQAGLREGDLILAVDHKPVKSLKAFHEAIDRSRPGTALPVAAWREGKKIEMDVPVGRETFRHWGTFAVGLTLPSPSNIGPFDLWPDPGFDLGVLGFAQPADHKEIDSVEGRYQRALHEKYLPSDDEWNAYLAIFRVSRGKNILSQESVPLGGVPEQGK